MVSLARTAASTKTCLQLHLICCFGANLSAAFCVSHFTLNTISVPSSLMFQIKKIRAHKDKSLASVTVYKGLLEEVKRQGTFMHAWTLLTQISVQSEYGSQFQLKAAGPDS